MAERGGEPSALVALVAEYQAAEHAEAQAVGALAFMGRLFVQATMPHRQTGAVYVERRNGDLTVRMTAVTPFGLPSGSAPRFVLSWLSTEAVRTRSRTLTLGDSFAAWLDALGVTDGGRDRVLYRRATAALFGTAISATEQTADRDRIAAALVAEQADLWWDPLRPGQLGLQPSKVTLSAQLYESVIESPVPIDLRAMRALSRSPLAIDLYAWLTYRMSYLRQPTTVPWEALHNQFGADYTRQRDFRRYATAALRKVATEYPAARMEARATGLLLRPSPSHVARLR